MTLQNQLIPAATPAQTQSPEHQVRLHEPFLVSAWHSVKKLLAFAVWLLTGFGLLGHLFGRKSALALLQNL